MFRRIDQGGPRLRFEFEGQSIEAGVGESLAAALLASGISALRDTPVSGAPRAPYCMMGVCFDCLVEIDGIANRQACLAPVSEGMVVRRQRGAPKLEAREFRAPTEITASTDPAVPACDDSQIEAVISAGTLSA